MTAALGGISRHPLPEAVRDDYLASYQGDRFAGSLRYLRSCPAELPALAGLLPHSKLDVIDAGHFTWEDAAAEYAALVTDWWRPAVNGSRK